MSFAAALRRAARARGLRYALLTLIFARAMPFELRAARMLRCYICCAPYFADATFDAAATAATMRRVIADYSLFAHILLLSIRHA